MQKKKKRKIRLFDVVNTILLLTLTALFIYPLYFTIIASFSDPVAAATGKVVLWPKGFTAESYINVFKNKDIWIGYKNAIIYTFCATILQMVFLIPAGYAMSKKKLPFRKITNWYFIITMYVGGGLIPTYMLIKNMGIINKPYTLIIIYGGFSVYNMIIVRTFYMSSISESLFEAAEVDGCSQIKQFFYIGIPLAKAIIAVQILFAAVGIWNDWYGSLLYISDKRYLHLQAILRNILILNQKQLSAMDTSTMSETELLLLTKKAYMAESMKYSVIFIASLPMLILYPFIQKHFAKGVMVGSLKG